MDIHEVTFYSDSQYSVFIEMQRVILRSILDNITYIYTIYLIIMYFNCLFYIHTLY